MPTIGAHGIMSRLPAGFEGRIFVRPSTVGRTYPVAQFATFPLPDNVGDFGSGAVTLMGERGEPADRPYGERSAFVQDPFGNFWYIATRLAGAPEGFGSVLPYLHPAHARQYIDFLQRAFAAEEMAVYEDAGRVMHAMVRLGDAVVELGEPEDRAGIPLNGLFFFVNDVDAAYARAVEAGATTVRPPNNIPSGLRSAIVRDPEGYFWWPAQWTR